jgi:hypothetical protein
MYLLSISASFIVSSAGEFSRDVLGQHFKHSNVRISTSVTKSLPDTSIVFVLRPTAKYVRISQDQPYSSQSAPST